MMVIFFWPKVFHREITLVASDGHSLPYAALIIHSKKEERHERTDGSGTITIPRFGTTALTVKDPRYVLKRWDRQDFESNLTVERTFLGSGLDDLAGRLLKKKSAESPRD